jgi:hypothetical protein
MTEGKDSGFGFRIRPLGTTEARTDQPGTSTAAPRADKRSASAAAGADNRPVPTAPAPPPAPPNPGAPPPPHTGCRFASAQAALAFLGAVAAAGLAAEARARRGPAGAWWVEVPAPWPRLAAHAAAAGARAYAGERTDWTLLPADGSAPAPPPAPGKAVGEATRGALRLHEPAGDLTLSAADWPEAGLADLVIATALRPARARRLDHVVCITPAALARTVLRRALNLGLAVRLGAAEREPLAPGAPAAGSGAAAWLCIAWGGERVPGAFLDALMRLPYTIVARAPGQATGAEPAPDRPPAPAADADLPPLLVDYRHATPLSSGLIAPLVPAGEHWLLAGPDAGHWRVRLRGRLVDAAELVAPPAAAAVPAPAATATSTPQGAPRPAPGTAPVAGALPTPPLPLRLVRRHGPTRAPDAVLLDDGELSALAVYLQGRPAAESAYLVLGPGRHLLLAPGGLLAGIPFGLPLALLGPGGLYLQQGLAFSPPLPETARARFFPTGDDALVAVSADPDPDTDSHTGAAAGGHPRADRFAAADALPVWTLWAGPPPAIAAGVDGTAAARLQALAAALEPKAPEQPKRKLRLPFVRRREAPPDRDALLREALALERAGRLVEAAQRLEQLGEPAAAGRLYERAAERASA